MFGGGKPSFGQTSATPAFGFNNTATASPFGQTAFGKPAAPSFGQANTFGQQTNSFFGGGQQQQQQQQPSGLFGAAPNAFGATPTTQSSFGGFAQPQQQQNTSFFGAAQPNANTSLYGGTTASAFGASKPSGFGFSQAQPTNSLFGQATAAPVAGTGFFGQTANPGAGLFGNATPGFGGTVDISGTANIKYQPSLGTDTLVKNGQTNTVNTKQHCITAMKEYETKSLEELRLDDYTANRKGPAAGAQPGMFGAAQPPTSGFFGAPAAQQQTTGLFGQPTDNKGGILGQTNTMGGVFGQAAPAFGNNISLFSKPFVAPATSANATFAFGNTTPATNTFGTKPFGAGAPSLFGQPATSAAPAFGQQSFVGYGGAAVNQAPSLFGQPQENKPLFGQPSAQPNAGNTFGFGTATNTSAAPTTGLFGPKPATAFGATSAFQPATSAAPAFSFGQTNTGGNSLFNNMMNKPAAPAFGGFGTQTAAAPLGGGLGLGAATGSSFFGQTANKPGGIFGTPTTQGQGGLFSAAPGFGLGSTLGGFGTNTVGGGGMANFGAAAVAPATVPIHQQILAMTTSPYGDNPIFKDLKVSMGASDNNLKSTNPAAQKAIIESSANQYKLSASKSTSSVKIKPLGNTVAKKSLFQGLEEYDSSVEESFSLKPTAKRLIIKPKSSPSSSSIQSPAHSGTLTLTQHQTSLSQLVSSPRSLNSSAKVIASQTSTDEAIDSFRNQIPMNASSVDAESTRRESWLQTNALDKVRQINNQKLSDSVLDNTLGEYNSSKDGTKKNSTLNVESDFPSSSAGALNQSRLIGQTSSDSFLNRSYLSETEQELSPLSASGSVHPTGIVLRRVGYYTIPSLDDLASTYLSEDGSCIVPNFTIGREGYGNVYYDQSIDVAGINLDEIVHFRHKEVIIYPDDDNKPTIGTALNRKAQITLDQVWPHDKTLHEPIKDPERLAAMDFEWKLRRVCDKHNTRFIEYRPETGSWVFKVDHFSKYGLTESDEDDQDAIDPKKAKLAMAQSQGAKPKTAKKIDSTHSGLTLLANERGNIGEAAIGLGGGIGANGQYGACFMEDDDNSMDFISQTHNNTDLIISPASPSAMLAASMRTDSHKLQLMKASFFNDDDYDGRSVFSEQLEGRDSPDQIVPRKPYSHLRDAGATSSPSMIATPIASPGALLQSDERDRALVVERPMMHFKSVDPLRSAALYVKPKVGGIMQPNPVIPFRSSIASSIGTSCCFADVAFMFGRSFRHGWAAQNKLTILSTAKNNDHIKPLQNISAMVSYFDGRGEIADTSDSLLNVLKVSSLDSIPVFEESIKEHLEIRLRYAIRAQSDPSHCPSYTAGGGTQALADHYELARSLNERDVKASNDYCVSVWSLCSALWDEREELEGHAGDSHVTIMCRRELLSDWLEEVVTERNLLKRNITKNNYTNHLMDLLTSHKVNEACELAFNNDDLNLAMLLAQLSGGPAVRQLLQHQLSLWQEVSADQFVAVERLKAIMLVAGIPLLATTNGSVNVFDNLTWVKAFALHLWYLCSPTASIPDSLISYERTFEAEEFYAASPSPPYTEQYDRESARPIQDLRYHILKLYSKRSHPIESLLNPASHTHDSMDFRLSWLMLQTFKTLGYHHISELSECQLHVSFASQLENNGLWHWAIFVLLHIPNRTRMELAVQGILYRYITLIDNDNDNEESDSDEHKEYLEKERFVIDDLHVPDNWIYWAKAVCAGSMKMYAQQAKYLLKAKQWTLAHEVIMTHLAPDAIINDNMPYLRSLLDQFEEPRLVSNWLQQGQILQDYMDISEKFESLKMSAEGDVETRWEGLKPLLADLCSRISQFPCPTAKHRLCQSEIAQRLACLVRGILMTSPYLNICLVIKMALEKLPLPQEYAQQELRVLLDTFLVNIFQQSKNHTAMIEN